jgi:hypothetical protein
VVPPFADRERDDDDVEQREQRQAGAGMQDELVPLPDDESTERRDRPRVETAMPSFTSPCTIRETAANSVASALSVATPCRTRCARRSSGSSRSSPAEPSLSCPPLARHGCSIRLRS